MISHMTQLLFVTLEKKYDYEQQMFTIVASRKVSISASGSD